jgi:hypothetical protein
MVRSYDPIFCQQSFTLRPCLEQNNAVTTGSDKIDLLVLSKCTNTSTYTMKPKPSNMNIGFTKPNNYDGNLVGQDTGLKLLHECVVGKFIGVLDCTQHTGDAGVACICMY